MAFRWKRSIFAFFIWRTTRTAEDGRITDRFSTAVEQLGATNKDGSKQIEPRLGGIYSLERIASDSKRDARTILELLCAYVRENAPRQIDQNLVEAQQTRRMVDRLVGYMATALVSRGG